MLPVTNCSRNNPVAYVASGSWFPTLPWADIIGVIFNKDIVVINRGTPNLKYFSETGVKNIILPFKAVAIAKHHTKQYIFLDDQKNVLTTTKDFSKFNKLHSFNIQPKTLFSDPSGELFIIIHDNVFQVVVSNTFDLVPTSQHACLLDYFIDPTSNSTINFEQAEIQLSTTNTLQSLVTLLERVHPELLLVCVMVLVPLLIIALPLLAVLSLVALRLYSALHHFTPLPTNIPL